MINFRSPLALASALALGLTVTATPLWAQDAGTPAAENPAVQPGGAFVQGEEVLAEGEVAIGAEYERATHGDWKVVCIRTPQDIDPCQLFQLLEDEAGNRVAQITILALAQGGDVVAGATVVTPIETLLTAQVTLTVDGGRAKRYPYTFCTPDACVAQLGFAAADVQALRSGRAAVVTIEPAVAPGQKVNLAVSLTGFTAGFNALQEINAENAQKVAALPAEAPPAGGN